MRVQSPREELGDMPTALPEPGRYLPSGVPYPAMKCGSMSGALIISSQEMQKAQDKRIAKEKIHNLVLKRDLTLLISNTL